jgi:hypothetical protein
MKHMLNLITGTCEECGDEYDGMNREIVRGLRSLAKKSGPLRDQLTIAVALDSVKYPSGCTCGRPRLDPPKPHAVECPAGKRGERYLEHLVESSAAPAKPPAPKPADAFTDADVAFVAGLRSKLGYGDEDVRTECPECGKPLTPAGENRVECVPCGVSLIADVSSAIDFQNEKQPLEVWHCPACDECFAFRQIPILNATVLAGDDQVPIACFACGEPLEQWIVTKPFDPKHGEDVTNLLMNKATAAAVLRDPDDTDPELVDEYMRGRFGSKKKSEAN